MKIEFYNSLSKMNDKECIEKYLIYNASLVIAGVKPSSTLTLKKEEKSFYEKWTRHGKDFLKSINLKYIILRESNKSVILLIYCEKTLSSHVFMAENQEFLIRIGYPVGGNTDDYLTKLKERYEKYKCPHELGVFLGFPLNDVRDFIECSSKKCLACGYWLVYNDIHKAEKIFNKYDQIKQFTMKCLLEDKSLKLVNRSIINLAINSDSRAI